jgi:hypothetical protein
MTKKDFELIAATLQTVRDVDLSGPAFASADADAVHADICRTFAAALAGTNPAFDRSRFLRACVPGANMRAR